METATVIVSILLIAIVLLQSGKAESANIIQGSSSELFQTRKEVLYNASSRGLDYIHTDILSKVYISIKTFGCTLRLAINKINNIKKK